MKTFRYDIASALESLRPEGEWKMEGNMDYESIQWLSPDVQKPTRKEVLDECARLKDLHDQHLYVPERQMAYPSIQDQLDMLYHDITEGTLESGSWIAAIKAVKETYPKP